MSGSVMAQPTTRGAPRILQVAKANARDSGSVGIAMLALAGLFVWAMSLNDRVLSYLGLSLLLQSSVVLVFAACSAAFVILIGDIDLGIGNFIGLANAVVAVHLTSNPMIGVLLIVALVASYGVLGLIIEVVQIPAIVATLGAAFVWFGLATLVLPQPGGASPGWLSSIVQSQPPLVPISVWIAVITAVVFHGWLFYTRTGLGLRALGSNRQNLVRSGSSSLRLRVTAYLMAGLLGVLAGLALTGVTGGGSATGTSQYTLLAIGGVILGGGEFSGGRVSIVGAVLGALSLAMVGSVVSLVGLSSVWQSAVVGVVLIVIMALRRVRHGIERIIRHRQKARQRAEERAVMEGAHDAI
ncbi:MAG: ABC transporter permease [Nocardioides sp.]